LQVNLFFVSLKYPISFTFSLAGGKTCQTIFVQSVLLWKFKIRDLRVADLGISLMGAGGYVNMVINLSRVYEMLGIPD